MNWFNRLKYLYAKAILFMQVPAERDCNISETAWIGHRSNLIRVTMGRYSYVGMNNSTESLRRGRYHIQGAHYQSINLLIHGKSRKEHELLKNVPSSNNLHLIPA